MSTWQSEIDPAEPDLPRAALFRAILRGLVLGTAIFALFAVQSLLRLIERPLHGAGRPWTAGITVLASRIAFRVLGMGHTVHGTRMKEAGALVSNHASWLDIFTLNATGRLFFVSKAEVASWPGIGLMARATGTMFIKRDRAEAAQQASAMEERLSAGHRLLFFPEGTSTDGLRVLPFKSTLFAAFYSDALRDRLHVQPVSVIYHAPKGEEPRFYGWWGDMEFGAHMLKTLGAKRQGRVDVVFHTPLRVADFDSRKDLARAAEAAVRSGLDTYLPDADKPA